MPTARASRTLTAAPQSVWAVVADPHHLPRWWPGVTRVEGVQEDHWTQVFTTKKGRAVRADFRLVDSEAPWRRRWEQEVSGTPFERVLNRAITEVSLEPAEGGTRVEIELVQKLRGYSRVGGFMLRRATAGKLEEALDGLERICA